MACRIDPGVGDFVAGSPGLGHPDDRTAATRAGEVVGPFCRVAPGRSTSSAGWLGASRMAEAAEDPAVSFFACDRAGPNRRVMGCQYTLQQQLLRLREQAFPGSSPGTSPTTLSSW